jgi:hypothetical protein
VQGGELFTAVNGDSGLVLWSELLTDEFTYSGFSTDARYANVGARKTAASSGFAQAGDFA